MAYSGKVKNLKESYGFVTCSETKEDAFFLAFKVVGGKEAFAQLRIGSAVTFDLIDHERGRRAENVQAV